MPPSERSADPVMAADPVDPDVRRFRNRTALVTGAGGPMGAAIAERLAREGARLALTDISARRLQATADHLRTAFPDQIAVVHRASVIVGDEVQKLVEALGAFGPIDVLINVVGGIRDTELLKPLLNISEQRWDDTFDLNLKGIFHLVRALVPGMCDQGAGTIVNISSIIYGGERDQCDYAAAKAAVASLTRSLALELAPKIRVNCIAPGLIATSVLDRIQDAQFKDQMDRNVLKRMGRPEDIAAAAAFLASDDAQQITGVILPVAGGIWPGL